MKTALAACAILAYTLGYTVQTKLATNMDYIIIAEANGGPSVFSYMAIMITFYGCAILATSAIGIAVLVKQWKA
jgi:hypothetical protein